MSTAATDDGAAEAGLRAKSNTPIIQNKDNNRPAAMVCDPEIEKRVVRKMDWHVMTLICFLYLLAFLDRSNVGNARLAGMATDLDLNRDGRYDWLLTIFYIGYIISEPLILVFKILPARIWMACVVFGWGVAATAQAGAQSWGGMMAARFFLAVFEAGFGPGAIYLLSFFYLRRELGLRTGMFICAAPLATCFAGALAYGITAGNPGIARWRLLFLVEGAPVLVMAVVTYFVMPNSPKEAWFLTEEEKQVALARTMRQAGKAERRGALNFKELGATFLDIKSWVTPLIYFSCNVSFASLPVFLPTILQDMGFSGLDAQGLSAPPYLLAFIVTIFTCIIADRTQQRGLTIICTSILGGAGYIMLAVGKSTGVRYAGVFLAAGGVFPSIGNVLPWVLNNQGNDDRRGAGIVLLNLVGQCGPLLGTRLYPLNEAPDYTKGHSICAAFMFFTTLLALLLRTLLARENRKLDAKYGRLTEEDQLESEGLENFGPKFRYVL